jgi:hypothetical protein
MVFGGIPEDSSELQVGIDSNREDMGLNPDPMEELKVKEDDPMWCLESSSLNWLLEDG